MIRRLLAGSLVAGALAVAAPAHAVDCPPAWGPRTITVVGLVDVTYCWPIAPND